MPRFVLEIGTEELPPRYFPVALPQLRADGEEMLRRARLSCRETKVYGTPRRLVLIAEDLAERQAPLTREERGPAAKVAFDGSGNPTKAALGFAKRHNLSPDDLIVKDTDQGKYVFAIIQEPELPAKEALTKLLPDLITGLSFPKTMRWGVGKLRFGRPIRWLLALVDTDVVEFELDGIKSGRLTRGHPVLAEGKMFEVKGAGEFEEALRQRFVVISAAKRENLILDQIQAIAEVEGSSVHSLGHWYDKSKWSLDAIVQDPTKFDLEMRASLRAPTVFLVEYPTAGKGNFDPSFLSLPQRVLEAEMIDVQSYFPLAEPQAEEDEEPKLLPSFIAVRDGGSDHLDAVIAGWENVLQAKLTDARYFYEQDRRRRLADRVEDLKGVVFQEKLGTMYEKTQRVRAVAEEIADQLRLKDDQRRWLERAASLCKADLTTEMVTEISNLQGVMGREYALKSGEENEVANAIAEHYRPRFAKDDLPWGMTGRLIGLADKLDTITAYFAIGLAPTGSADPFGLRREGMGVARILGESPDDLSALSTRRLIEVALSHIENTAHDLQTDGVPKAIWSFLRERLSARLREQEIRYDLVNAALAIDTDIRDSAFRARALHHVAQNDPDFLKTVIACTRPTNIAKGFEHGEVDPSLLQEEAEGALWSSFQEVEAEAKRLAAESTYTEFENYVRFFGLLGRLPTPINTFFDDVLVMAEDEALRRNRLALCWKLSQLFRRLADFTLIVQT
jgi:glycyl-tRNA synthetase beta chain